jgi:hypothetical protein
MERALRLEVEAKATLAAARAEAAENEKSEKSLQAECAKLAAQHRELIEAQAAVLEQRRLLREEEDALALMEEVANGWQQEPEFSPAPESEWTALRDLSDDQRLGWIERGEDGERDAQNDVDKRWRVERCARGATGARNMWANTPT